MHIKVTRAFSATKQIKQYEPIDSFCEVAVEFDSDDNAVVEEIAKNMILQSEKLDLFCRTEVRKTIESVMAQQEKLNNKKNRKVEVKEDAKNTAETDVESEIN